MQDIPIAIIGGGLSGLYAAFLLEQKGLDYILIEARDRLGGRIAVANSSVDFGSKSVDIDDDRSNDGFDLGPSWFWPEYQPQLSNLIDALGLPRFVQFEEGDMMVERGANELPIRTQGYQSSPPSMRLVGGMTALTDALYARLDAKRIVTGQIVRRLTKTDKHGESHQYSEDSQHSENHQYIEIECEYGSEHINAGQTITHRAQHVLLALPPRLVASNIVFEPALPQDLAIEWQETDTWMAPHAKYVAVYDSPFWRDSGLSGAARSVIGPLTEIHDASLATGEWAVFGFFGVPAHVRQSVSEMDLKAHCRAQMVRLFGEQADKPTAEYIKDWSQDAFTATTADASSSGQHTVAPTTKPKTGLWQDSLIGSASEWSEAFPGYIAGAIDAANKAVQELPTSILR